MANRHKILLLDDDPELLDTFSLVLSRLPSDPEIHTANNGPRAMAMMEAEPYRLLICDLKMPKMDGLQVLSIVRRKHPEMRTVALTSIIDEQYRSRAYALGVDLFWYKPNTEQEIKMFLECLESLIGRDEDAGFRGVQSKSLVDIIQLECISQNSAVLRITNGPMTGKIWIQEGEIIDAETQDLNGEAAFTKILSWKAGSFEAMGPEPDRTRTIFKSYNGLLLETAQALDELQSGAKPENKDGTVVSPLSQISQIEGIEFVLAMNPGEEKQDVARGLENPERMSLWARQTLTSFRELGDKLHAGALDRVDCLGPQRNVSLAWQNETEFCLGWKNTMKIDQMREMTKKVFGLWAS
jgi:CheY-like chemotaxis protein